jgi:hypothetical protein
MMVHAVAYFNVYRENLRDIYVTTAYPELGFEPDTF